MGHYDNCRPGYCGKCGAAPGNMRPDGSCPFCYPRKVSAIDKLEPPKMPPIKSRPQPRKRAARPLAIGDCVDHARYHNGVVVEVNGSMARVFFDSMGGTMLCGLPTLTRIAKPKPQSEQLVEHWESIDELQDWGGPVKDLLMKLHDFGTRHGLDTVVRVNGGHNNVSFEYMILKKP